LQVPAPTAEHLKTIYQSASPHFHNFAFFQQPVIIHQPTIHTMLRLLALLLTALPLAGIIAQNADEDAKLRRLADRLAHRYIITDGHVDLPYRLKVQNFRLTKELIGIPIETTDGDFDYVRAKKGGLDAPFMSIYIPRSYQ